MQIKENEIVKPSKLNETLISRTASKLGVSEDIVEKIISFQFKDAFSETRKSCEIEFAGLGVFRMTIPKMRKRLEKYDRILNSINSNKTELRQSDELRAKDLEEKMGYLKERIDRCVAKLNKRREDKLERIARRNVELVICEGVNREDS